MNQDPLINKNDPLFLASRELDGDLTVEEAARLSDQLAASSELQAEVEQFRKVGRWIDQRKQNQIEIDWQSHEKLIVAQIGADAGELSGVDQLLQTWAKRKPLYNERAYANAITTRLGRSAKRSPWRIVARLGAPLAAAAAVALVITAGWFSSPEPRLATSPVPLMVVQIGPGAVTNDERTVLVSFASTTEITTNTAGTASLGFMALGSSPVIQQPDESPL